MPKESVERKKIRARKIVSRLKDLYPDAKCSLNYENPFQLLISTMLSAQCTDERVNKTTPALFAKFPTPEKMSMASLSELEELVRSTGFFKNKAKSLKESSQQLVSLHSGKVPDSLEDLTKLRGVGRKTANVVLGNAFGMAAMVVDTHVTRLSNRMDLAVGVDAVKLEHQLEKVVDQKDWTIFSHLLIRHGREICVARKPRCTMCELVKLCPRKGV